MSEFKIKVSVDLDTKDVKSQLDALDKDYKINATVDMSNINKQIQTLKKNFQDAFNISSKDTKGLNNLIKTLSKLTKDSLSTDGVSTKKVTNLTSQYKDLANTVSKLQKQLDKGGLGEKAIDRTKEQMTDLLVQMQKIKSQMSETERLDIDLFNQKLDNKALIDMNNYISKIEANATSLETKLNSISFKHIDDDKLSNITNRLKEIKETADNIDINFEMEGINKILSDLSEIQSEIKNLEKVENLASSFDKIASSASEVGVEIRDLDGIISNLSSEASNLDGSFDRAFSNAKSEANQFKNEIKEIESAMNSTSKKSKSFGKSVFGTMDDFTGNFKQFTLAEVAGDFISDGIRTTARGIKDTVVETDAAIVDLKKVYDGLDSEGLKTYLLDVTEVAKGTGQESVDVIQGTAKAIQSGIKDIDDALAYSRQSAIFSNVGDVDQGQADTIITSIMSAYGGVENALKPIRENIQGMGEDYNTLTKFTDLANYAGNNFAVSTADVGTALQQSAAALQANGVSMEESVGMVVAMNEVLQDANKSGNALKSISSNLAGVAVSAKDGTLQSNKTAKALKEIANIDVWDEQTGQVKDMYQVMDELHQKWDDLSEAERNALGTTIAGKTQLNAFNALVGNWEQANQLVEDYKNGLTIGSAEEENLAYLDSIQGKWNAIKENLKSIVNSIITSDLVKKVLDVIEQITTKIAEFASSTNFGDDFLGLGAVVATLGTVGVVTSKLTGMAKAVKTLISIGKTASTISTVATSLGKLGKAATVAGGSTGGVKALASALGGIGGTAVGITAATVAIVGLATAIGDSTKAMSKLQESETGIGDAIASGSEMINGIVQTTGGTGWKFLGGVGKTIGAVVTGQFSEIDDIWKETSANINTNLNEGLSDATATTATALQTIKKSTQDELSDVHDIYNNTFSKLPNLTATNMDDVANTLVEQTRGMNSDMLLVCEGMGGEIGATLFNGITQSMGDSEKRKQFERNLKTLINSEIIVGEEVGKIVDTFNVEYEKALDSHSSFKQAGTDVFNQLKKGLRDGDLKDACQDASKEMSNWTNDMFEQQRQAGKAWSALLDGVTEDMTDKERYKKMKKNLDDFMDEYNLTKDEAEDLLRDEQIEMHAELDMEFEAEQSAEKAKAEMQQQFENLDLDTKVKLATEFEGADDEQLAIIYDTLQRFPKEVQTKLKGEGFKEVLMESENTLDFLKRLPEKKLIEIMSDVQFVGELTPEELEVAAKRIPDEDLKSLLYQTKFLNGLSPENLAIMLKELPEDMRIELITEYINKGKRTPEQIAATLQTLPEEKIAQIITEYKENGASPEQINRILMSLPPEVRTVVRAILEGKEKVEEHKENVEEVPKEKTTTLKVKEENPGKTKEVKEELEVVDSLESNPKIKVKKEDGEPEKTKEELDTLDNKEANPKINPLSDNSGMYMTDEQLNIMDNKKVNPKIETKSDDKEIDETNKKLDETDGKTATANVEVKVNAPTTSSGDEGMYTDKDALLRAVGLSENQTVTQTVEVKAEVTGVDTSGVAQITIDPIKMKAVVSEVDTTAISNIQAPTIKILADSSNAMLKIQNVTSGLTGIKDKTVKILADSSNAMLKIQNVKSGLAGIKDKTVTIKANASQAMSAINSVKSALSGVRSKTVSVSVNKTVTEKTVSQSSNTRQSTPMLTNSSLASVPVSASASSLSDAPVTISETPSLANTTVSAKASSYGILDKSKILPSLDLGISHIKNLEEALERLGSQLDFIDEKAEATFGQEKVNLLQQQIPLLREQQKIQEKIAKNERSQNNELVYWLSNKGFTFDKLGNITNYNNKLLQMEQNVESLKKKHDALNDASGNNKNEAAIKSANKAYESANETLSKTKKYLDEYFATNNKEITEASKKWWEYENSIRDTESAIRDLLNARLENEIELIGEEIDFLESKIDNLNDGDKVQYLKQENVLYKEQQGLLHELAEQMRGQLATLNKNSDEYAELQKEIINLSTEWWELEGAIKETNETLEEIRRNKAIEPLQNSLEEINYLLDRQSDRLDLIDSQYENTTGTERVEGLIKKEQILNEQLVAQEDAYKRIYNVAAGLQKDLWQFGFKLDANSLISNYDEVLNSLVGTADYERAKEYADEYMEVVRGDLIDIQVEANGTKNAIADIAREMQEALDEAREERLEPFKNSLEDVRYELDRVSDELDLLNASNERSQGKTKIDALRSQIELLNEEIQVSEKEFSALYNLITQSQNDLWQYGFRLDQNSLISNYDDVLNGLVGSAEYENAKKSADEYMQLMRDDYIENKLGIIEVQNEIKNLQDEIEKAERELALFSSRNKLTELNTEFEELSNKLDMIDSKLGYAYGTDKVMLMRKEVELLNNQLELQSEKMDTMTEQSQIYANSLSKYGFTFDTNGSISNYQEIMELFRDSEQIENIKELCEEYMDLQNEVKDLSSEYNNLENSVKDAYREMLDTTKDIEDELTDVIEKEYEIICLLC